MGEAPEVVKIACPGCETQFRLKPKKGRLPKGPVPCPKCAESIPIVEENIRRNAADTKKTQAPQAQVFNSGGSDASKKPERRGTFAGAPANTPHRTDAVSAEEEDEFDHVAVSPGLSNSNPKSTFLGMGSALQAVAGAKAGDDKTAVVDDKILAKIRSESSVVEDDDDDQASDPLRETAENKDVHVRQTSENKAITADDLERAKHKMKEDDGDDASKEEDQKAPGHMVLGKIKIKKKLKRRAKQKKEEKSEAKSADETVEKKKPSLSALLKKARDRKDELSLPRPKPKAKDGGQSGAEQDLDRALDDLASETARAIEDEQPAGADPKKPASDIPAFDSGDSSMIDLLRRRVAENQQPGAASERRGSGYIRLPTAEIQDVLGQGTYRLRVEDIVYEPIDKQGLTQLVKRGVLLGAEEIAEPDGDWMPIADHPVFKELRRKMAREAHDLLKKYGPAMKPEGSDDAELPAPQADLPAPQAELPAPQASLPGSVDAQPASSADFSAVDDVDEADDIPTLEAELEEEAEEAAKELFADDDVDEAAEHAPPPMPGKDTPAEDEEADEPAGEESDDSSIQLDYDALGVEENDVEVEYEEPVPADETGSRAVASSSMRTWIPLLTAAAVVGALAVFAFTPMGRPYLESILGQSASDDAPESDTKKPKASGNSDDQEKDPTAKVSDAVTAASSSLAQALAVDPSDPKLQEQVAAESVEAGEFDAAARVMNAMWDSRRDDADFAARFADVLVKAGRFADARRIAVDGVQLGSDKHDFSKIFADAVANDPALGDYTVVDIDSGVHADGATAVKNGERVALEFSKGDDHVYTFLPSQSGWEDEWRASIASYRLCQIMVCNFEVPRSRPARIDKATFDKLPLRGPEAAGVSRLNWVTEDGKKYVYGVLQDATSEPARFPIEDTDLWRNWLATGSTYDLQKPVKEALSALEGHSEGFYEPIVAQAGDEAIESIAAQLSTVLVFDYLTNNWDRFRSGEDKWGTNLYMADGSLVSKDNGTAFQPRASTRVKGRFRWTSRYSADTITSLRLMSPELVSGKLFPNPSAAEEAKLDVFWSQRDRTLERVESLTRAHGDKEVLAFE